jgi:hypothetical protein
MTYFLSMLEAVAYLLVFFALTSQPRFKALRWLMLIAGIRGLILSNLTLSLAAHPSVLFYAYWYSKMVVMIFAAYTAGNLAITLAREPQSRPWILYLPAAGVGFGALINFVPAYPSVWNWYIYSLYVCGATVLCGIYFHVAPEFKKAMFVLLLLFAVSALGVQFVPEWGYHPAIERFGLLTVLCMLLAQFAKPRTYLKAAGNEHQHP